MRRDQDYFEETRLGKPYDLKLLRRLRPFTRPHRRLIFWSVGLVVLITLLDLALPYVTKLAIDRHIVPRAASAPDSRPGPPPAERYLSIDLSDPAAAAVWSGNTPGCRDRREHRRIAFADLPRLDRRTCRIAPGDLAGLTGLAAIFWCW
jgi:ATP-binding cassette subfamily B protein